MNREALERLIESLDTMRARQALKVQAAEAMEQHASNNTEAARAELARLERKQADYVKWLAELNLKEAL